MILSKKSATFQGHACLMTFPSGAAKIGLPPVSWNSHRRRKGSERARAGVPRETKSKKFLNVRAVPPNGRLRHGDRG
jgi:hypothetical protein